MKWIQKIRIRRGALHKQLSIPKEKQIPVSLLNAIIKAKPGDIIKNPSPIGLKKIKVTRKLEKRANLALNLKRI